MARASAEAGDMMLATTVTLLPLFNPVDLAEQIATLDIMCKGRFAFGVALGWRATEFEALGVPREERLGRFLEALELIKRLWTEEPVTFQGKYYRVNNMVMNTKPVQKPRPPIWVGASTEAAIKRAAELGDAWIISTHLPFSALVRYIETYREALEKLNRPFPKDFPAIRNFYIARDRETAFREARPYLEASYKVFMGWGLFQTVLSKVVKADMSYEEWLDDTLIIGDPDDCIEKLSLYREKIGVNHFIFLIQRLGMEQAKVLDAIRLLGEKVIPHLRD